MKWITFSVFCVFYLALLLFADYRPAAARVDHEFAAAYDLSTTQTMLHAPAEVQANGWKASQIPTERLVSPLIILQPSPTGVVGLREIVDFEKQHGTIPPGAFVVANSAPAAFDFEALRFLAEGRNIYGIGATGRVDYVSSASYIAAKGMYVVEDLALPIGVKSGAILTIAPQKADASIAPARLIALERNER